MSNWKNLIKRGFAVFLSLTLCLSLMNVSAFAEETTDVGSDDAGYSETNDSSDSGSGADVSNEDEDDAGQSDEDEDDAGQSDEDEDDAGQSDEDENDAGQSDEDKNDADQSDEDKNDADQSGEDKNDADQSDEDKNDADQSDEDKNDADQSGEETKDPAEGEGDAQNPAEGEGDVQNPAEGEGDAQNPAEGEGDAQNPAEGEGDAQNPAEGEGDAQLPEGILPGEEDLYQRNEDGSFVLDENGKPVLKPVEPELPPVVEETPDALSSFLSKVEAIGSGELDMDQILAAIDDCLSSYEQLSEEEKAALADAYAALLAYKGELLGELPPEIMPMDGAVAMVGEVPYGTLQEAVSAVQDGETITLTAPVNENITAGNDVAYTLDLGGFAVTGTGSGSVITVTGGDVTIQNGTVTGGKAPQGGGLYVDGADVSLNGVTITGNAAVGTSPKDAQGGGVYLTNGAKLTMNSGDVSNNVANYQKGWDTSKQGGTGGGVYLSSGTSFVLKGGAVDGNEAGAEAKTNFDNAKYGAGGGVFVEKGASFTLDGGTVSNNSAYSWASRSNAHCGGGIYVEWGQDAQLLSGTISENMSYSNGGGVYVDRGQISLKNVAITGNGADNPQNGSNGGGVWFCDASSDSYFYATSGALITDNNSDRRGSDFFATAPHWYYGATREIHLPTRLNDGSRVEWSDEKTDVYEQAYLTELGADLTNAKGEPITHFTPFLAEEFQGILNDISSVANVSLGSSAGNGGRYSLYITDNHAAQGGGIACNGSLIMGEDSDKTLTINKVWKDAAGNELTENLPESVIVTVKRDGKTIDTVTLSAENDWTATLIDLPADGTYTVEEAKVDGYDASYSEITTDSDGNWSITITNAPTPEPGKLTITKEWSDGSENHTADAVTVEVLDGNNEVVATVTLNSNNDWTAEVEIAGSLEGYTVRETNLKEGYSVSYGAVSKVSENEWTVTVTNTLIPPPTPTKGNLLIVKQINGGGSAAREKVYTFTVTGPDGFSRTVTITGEGSALLEELEPGEYTVTEDRAGAVISGYTLSISGSGDSATVTAGGTANVTITNTYTTPGGGDPGDDDDDDPTPPPTPEIPEEDVPLTDIPEEETPLSEIPEEPEELEIPEEEVPLADVPETGDLGGGWMMAMLMGALGMLWMKLSGKKRPEEEEG